MRGPFIGCATGARRGADEPLEGVRKASRRGNKDCRGPSVVAPRLASTAKAGQTASSRGKPAQAEFGPMYRARLFQLSQIHLAALGIFRKNSKILAKSRQEVLTKAILHWYPPLNHAANSIFFRAQLPVFVILTATNEFANRGKLSGKLANSFAAPRKFLPRNLSADKTEP